MTTQLEQIQEDYTAILAEYGVPVDVDGESVLAFMPAIETELSPYNDVSILRLNLFHLVGSVSKRQPQQRVVIDGETWVVGFHQINHISGQLSLFRYVS